MGFLRNKKRCTPNHKLFSHANLVNLSACIQRVDETTQRNSPRTKTHADREIKAEGGIEKHMAGTEQETQHSILERSGAATVEKA